jgi:NADPH-dependent FMN reductase
MADNEGRASEGRASEGAGNDDTQRSFLFIVGSGRPDGNTEMLARIAAGQLPPDLPQRWIQLHNLELPVFRDVRHDQDPATEPAGAERLLLDETLAATDLVIVSPLYWYSVSWSVKLYLDYWSRWLRVPEADFKGRMRGKNLWSVTVMADDDYALADPLLGTLKLSASYLDARFAGALLGRGSWPGDVLKDRAAVERAHDFFDVARNRTARIRV